MRQCQHCKYFLKATEAVSNLPMTREEHRWKPACSNPKNMSLIDGRPWYSLETLRYGVGISDEVDICGERGDWWEPMN